MTKFVCFRKLQENYREQNKIKQRLPKLSGEPIVLDNGYDSRLAAVYSDGRVKTSSGDVYDGVARNGHQLHVVNKEPMPFKSQTARQRLLNMGFGKKQLEVVQV